MAFVALSAFEIDILQRLNVVDVIGLLVDVVALLGTDYSNF